MKKKPSRNASKNWDFFDLPRPQYSPTPELLLSALVWSVAGEKKIDINGETNQGIVFKKTDIGKSGKRNIVETYPDSSARIDAMTKVISSNFGMPENSLATRAAAILGEDLVGNVPAKANAKAIVPLNLTTALMQDVRGVTGVDNPPNYSRMVQRIYSLGLGGGDGDASLLLVNSLYNKTLAGGDWLEAFVNAMAPEEIKKISAKVVDKASGFDAFEENIPSWLEGIDTPFHWFASAWNNLTSVEWGNAMPRRRWVDWASCVLRTAIGSSYIFEMNFYYQLVLGLSTKEAVQDVKLRALSSNTLFFNWDTSAGVSARDISSKIKKLCERGTACRTLLSEWVALEEPAGFPIPSNFIGNESGLEDWLLEGRAWVSNHAKPGAELWRQLVSAIAGKANKASNNVYETINYSLLDRGKSGEDDLYSLMRKRGRRFTVVEPGQEWFVVIASLTSSAPSSRTRVADLMASLDAIGIEASYKTIVGEIERVGLGRSSHDADDAIEIATAF